MGEISAASHHWCQTICCKTRTEWLDSDLTVVFPAKSLSKRRGVVFWRKLIHLWLRQWIDFHQCYSNWSCKRSVEDQRDVQAVSEELQIEENDVATWNKNVSYWKLFSSFWKFSFKNEISVKIFKRYQKKKLFSYKLVRDINWVSHLHLLFIPHFEW